MGKALALSVAVGDNGAIGKDGGLPWDYPEDRAHFDAITRGHVVIMGRRTWEEAGKPLEGRDNVVVTRSADDFAGATVVRTLAEAIAYAQARDAEPFVIGGVRLFQEAMPLVTRVYITRIPESPPADAFFVFDDSGFRLDRERTGERGARYQVWEREHA